MAKISFDQNSSARKTRGFTLTELAIVLGVIGIILSAIWVAAAQVYESNRTKLASTETLTIVSNWQSVLGSKKVDTGQGVDITSMTANNNFASQEMYGAGGCPSGGSAAPGCVLLGAWGGSLVQVVSMQSQNAIMVKYEALTQEQCERYANAVSGAAGLIAMIFNGSTAYSLPPLGTSAVPTAAQINAACSLAAGNSVQAEFSMN